MVIVKKAYSSHLTIQWVEEGIFEDYFNNRRPRVNIGRKYTIHIWEQL
jgi:hypothetical protein